ncbi:hypothetical protein Dsin_008400 [Dipteronia sinensis]|uniref:SWIM-type domain-containing protein n=1 Tax=Dipteronia sinensis TaxID=43782 RepID=A0AAE0APA6_9ROSI|nr:hypothetical protein Dsin_008400 [Dipteronia sinensis]
MVRTWSTHLLLVSGMERPDEAWTWFLLHIREVIGTPEHLVVISDRHNSIANGMRNVYPTVPHCICYYHLKQNLKKKAPKRGDVMQLYKLVAYSYRTEVCDKYLTNISNIHRRSFDYLVDVGVERWSLAYCPEKRYGFMTTNIAEVINTAAKKARKLPITSLVEFLRDLMQKWFYNRRKAANKGSSVLTDFALEHGNKIQEKSQQCVVQPIDYTKYVVKDNEGIVWTVDLELRTCTCRKFDLDRLPCAHAIAVCKHIRVPKERLCSDYFTTQWLQTAYALSIHPVPHPSSWVLPEHVSSCIVHPPEDRRPSGRPKKIRIRSSLEGPETRVCTNCGESGHNRITCTKPRKAPSISKSSSSSIGQKPSVRRQRACGRCGVLGHNIQTCSNVEAKP